MNKEQAKNNDEGTPTLITRQQVAEHIRHLGKAHPNAFNPRGPRGTCLYTKHPSDTGLAADHCIVGQTFVDFGVECPGPLTEVGIFDIALTDQRAFFEHDAIFLLNDAQLKADAAGTTWGDVVRALDGLLDAARRSFR